MSVLTDLVQDIEDYPHNHLTIEITGVDPDGDNINADEEVGFDLQVTNTGPLTVRDLQLMVRGKNGVLVKGPGAAAPFETTALSNIFDVIPAHTGDSPVEMAGKMRFRVPDQPSTEADLIVVTVEGWNTDFNHMTTTHAQEDREAKVTFRAEVLPPT